MADFNGDGLSDLLTGGDGSGNWNAYLNTGTGFAGPTGLGGIVNEDRLQIADVNGDGRADLLHPVKFSDGAHFMARLALPDGDFSGRTAVPGGYAYACVGNDCNMRAKAQMFTDLDADGALDYFAIKIDDVPDFYWSSSGPASRFQPRDVITHITNGYGAATDITYHPLTNGAVYRRDTNSRNTRNYGRGAAVQDLLAPTYVVSKVSSSSPRWNNPDEKAHVYYRYAGAKVQAGGRGFLGFREIVTYDVNYQGGTPTHVTVATTYRQDFPYVGMPLRTVKRVVNGAFEPETCRTVVDNACYTPTTPFATLPGAWFSEQLHSWETQPGFGFEPGTQRPVQAHTGGTEEKLRDPFTDTETSRVVTTFDYDDYGNTEQTTVSTFADPGTSEHLLASVITANEYADDNSGKWRLGRLTRATITHKRPGQPDIVRTSSFDYAMAGPATGLLTEERIQPDGPADQDLRKLYTLDVYGNRVQAVTCTPNVANGCAPAGLVFHSDNAIHRYSRTEYDVRGRFPTTSYEPFWNGSGAVEALTQVVVARNVFGDVTHARNAMGVNIQATAGTLGRSFYSWTQTKPDAIPGEPTQGAQSWTRYRWCRGHGPNSASCPAGAVFRQEVFAEGAPRRWSYFDRLGRPMLEVAETLNAGIVGKEFSAVCSFSDAAGKPERVSNPFFLSDPANDSGKPDFSGQTDPCASRLWSRTDYDPLGRPTLLRQPDGSTRNLSYAGLKTTSTDALGRDTEEVKNALGEIVSVEAPAGRGEAATLTTTYVYDATGNLRSVTRDAGRGPIINSYEYDALGRKHTQIDPDAGTWAYAYNAAGELIEQSDARGARLINDYDARGRTWRKRAYNPDGTLATDSGFEFDTAANGLGMPESEVTVTGSTVMSRGYSYDALGRPEAKAHWIDGVTYTEAIRYDNFGRPRATKDATGRWLHTDFHPFGFVQRLCEADVGSDDVSCLSNHPATMHEILETDARGQVVRERRGAVEIARGYDSFTGRLISICAGGAGCALQNDSYEWDVQGNLRKRERNGNVEHFAYDRADRLIRGWFERVNGITYPAEVPGNQNDANVSEWLSYDKLGNLCARKRSFGSTITQASHYAGRAGCGLGDAPGSGTSDPGGAHRAIATGGSEYSALEYDANGNQTIARDHAGNISRQIDYNARNQGVRVILAGTTVEFRYGPDDARFKRIDSGGKTTLYLGNVERIDSGGVITWKRYLGGTAVQTLVGINPALPVTQSLLHDHLGSVVSVADSSGALAEKTDFTAWGDRRSGQTFGDGVTATKRGFTGHEHVDEMRIVHMNGRLYDFAQARFVQADPLVQAPDNPQNWNPYGYVFNNPLAYTDPTGMWGKKEQQWLRTIAAIGITVWTGGAAAGAWGPALTTGQALAVVGAGGFAAGAIQTGTFKGGIQGAFTATTFFGVGQWATNLGYAQNSWQRIAMHAAAGGILDELQGGKFGHGFLSAGLSKAVMSNMPTTDDPFGDGVITAIAGGTISELTGGKFANGAVTAAMQFAFNQMFQLNPSPERVQRGVSEIRKRAMQGAAEDYATKRVGRAMPKSTIAQFSVAGGGGVIPAGAVQGDITILNPPLVPGRIPTGVATSYGGMLNVGSSSVSYPSADASTHQFALGGFVDIGPAFGITNATRLQNGTSTALIFATQAATLNINYSQDGIWSIAVGTPAAGYGFIKQEVNTKVWIGN